MPRLRVVALVLCLWGALACQPAAAPSAKPAAPTTAASGPAPTIAAAAAQATATPAPVALRFGLNTTTAEVTPAWVAKDTGLFAKYGLDVELATLSAD